MKLTVGDLSMQTIRKKILRLVKNKEREKQGNNVFINTGQVIKLDMIFFLFKARDKT